MDTLGDLAARVAGTSAAALGWHTVNVWLGDRLRERGEQFADFGVSLVLALLIVLVARVLVIWTGRRLRRRRLIGRLGVNVVTLLVNVVAIGIYVIALAMILGVFGASLSALITYLSVTTLAIGLALQETLRNTIAGIYLLAERPFNIGDRVSVRDVTGRIENVEIRTTAVRSDAGDQVLIPNSIVFTEIVTNRSATRFVRTRVQVAKMTLSPVETQLRLAAVAEAFQSPGAPEPEVQAVAKDATGCTASVAIWHDPAVPIRTRLIERIESEFPESDVSSSADVG